MDIVERLRKNQWTTYDAEKLEAANEIERLREAAKDRPKDRPNEIERLREALKNMLRWHDQLSPADIAKAEAALKDNQ